MKLSKRSRWILVIVGLLIASVLILTQVKSVRATFTNAHAGIVLLRVEREIMQQSPAGRYYESLFWKHNDEIIRIAREHPENDEEFWRVTRLFIPGLEALLDGEGDTVQITAEQVESLQAELDWMGTTGSPSLREDIEKEKERLPLDSFVGLSMSDALDFINNSWAPDAERAPQSLVPGDEQWAYYVYDNIYLEYPASYSLQVSESKPGFVYLIPITSGAEEWNPCVMGVRIWEVPLDQQDAHNPYPRYSRESEIVWESPIQQAGFEGLEFMADKAEWATVELQAFAYHAEAQRAVHVWVLTNEKPEGSDAAEYAQIVDGQYGYLQHLIASLQFWP
jgi:hypothetical protein